MALTPFGKIVRMLRIKYDFFLKDMADAMDVTPSYISAIELGNKPLSHNFVLQTIKFFKQNNVLTSEEEKELLASEHASKRVYARIDGLTLEQRDAVVAFARRLKAGESPENLCND